MIKKLGVLGNYVCTVCAILFSGLIVFQNLNNYIQGWQSVLGIVCSLIVLCLVLKSWKFERNSTAGIVFLIRFLIALLVIVFIDAEPIQDFGRMYDAAKDIMQGERDYLENVYFYNCAYQTGFSIYESVILRLFGTSRFPLQIMNALWLGGIGMVVTNIAFRIFPSKVAASVSVLHALYPAPYFLAAVLTNQHMSTFFFYLAVLLLIANEELNIKTIIISGIFIAIGNIMRPEGIIMILAIICWKIVVVLLNNEKSCKEELIKCGGLIVSYALVIFICSNLIIFSGLNPEGLSDNQPMWRFVLGFNQESNGTWNQEDYQNYMMLPPEEAKETMREVAKERLLQLSPKDMVRLAIRKSDVMWGDYEYMYWGFGHLDGQKQIGFLTLEEYLWNITKFDKGVYTFAFVFAVIGIVATVGHTLKNKEISLLIKFIFCGYYAAYMIGEVQTRYRYVTMPAVFLLSGYGIWVINRKVKGKKFEF